MYTAKTRSSNKRKTVLIAALAACLILAVGGGVLAWFSAQDSVTNTFVQGDGITDPDKEPDPDNPTKPDPGSTVDPDGFITETEWVNDSSITPNSIVDKSPTSGLGKDSASAYVFAEVENNLGEGTYFILGDNWMAVEATPYTSPEFAANLTELQKARAYKSGLFVYTGGGTNGAVQLNASTYTGELFRDVYINSGYQWPGGNLPASSSSMLVKAYLVAQSNDKEDLVAKYETEILPAAKAWAAGN